LGTWQLLQSWSDKPTEQVETRLALQLVNEPALCVNGIREKRTQSILDGLRKLSTNEIEQIARSLSKLTEMLDV
jgi:hypothetical protein